MSSLAQALGMSKAGVVGPFGSQQELQRAVLAQAAEMFIAAVIQPSLDSAPGLNRLHAVVENWCGYLTDGPSLNGVAMSANQEIQLLADTNAGHRVKRIMLAHLDALSGQ